MSLFSPLLFPVYCRENIIFVLDETALPFDENYVKVGKLSEALDVLGQMKTRSLGQVLLFFYSCALFNEAENAYSIAEEFLKIRPTFDFMFIAGMIEKQKERGVKPIDAAKFFVDHFDKTRRMRVKVLAGQLPQDAKIATVCNVNGELIYLYEELISAGKKCEFIVCETRPYLQGTRLTFWELTKNDIPARLCCDNQISWIMKNGGVNCVVTGADRASVKGDIINKIGTYAISRAAHEFGIPFYALTQYPRDIDIDTIKIELRPANEVFMYIDNDKIFHGDALYPCFDVVKGEYITKSVDLNNPGK
ncbi:MAG: hypothetical protein PHC58_02755 [Candidatus Omnitrophica bacterium]|nr:hypothetical protein [Candidatus Omnitrophota bacterium]